MIAAGKPARVVALVLDPQPHVPLRRLRDGELHLVHVSRRKVRRFARRAPSRRQVHDEEAIGRQPVEVAHNVRPHHCRVRAVPACKRQDRSILPRRGFEVRRCLAHRRHRNLLPRTLRRCLCLQCRCQEWEQKNCESGFHGATPKGCFWFAEEYTYQCRQGATPPLPATRKPARRALSLVTRAAKPPIRVRLRSVRRSVRRWSGGP
jgi:hypothetical protein